MLQDKMVKLVLLTMVEMVVWEDQEVVEGVEAKEMEKVELLLLMEVLVEQDLLEEEVEELMLLTEPMVVQVAQVLVLLEPHFQWIMGGMVAKLGVTTQQGEVVV